MGGRELSGEGEEEEELRFTSCAVRMLGAVRRGFKSGNRPLAGEFSNIPRRHPAPQRLIKPRIQRTNTPPPLHNIDATPPQPRLLPTTVMVVPNTNAQLPVQRIHNCAYEPAHIEQRYPSPLCYFERIEREQVAGGYAIFLEGGEEVRVRLCG